MLNKTKKTEDGSQQSYTSFYLAFLGQKIWGNLVYFYQKTGCVCVPVYWPHTSLINDERFEYKTSNFLKDLQVEWIQIKQFKKSYFNLKSVEIYILFLHRIITFLYVHRKAKMFWLLWSGHPYKKWISYHNIKFGKMQISYNYKVDLNESF